MPASTSEPSGRCASAGRGRAQSTVIGAVLILGIVLLGVTVVLAVAGPEIDQTLDLARNEQAEQQLTTFDSQASLVALGAATNMQVDLPHTARGQIRTAPDAGWMKVTTVDPDTGAAQQTVANVTLGAVIFEQGNTEIAYQGGGVWRKQGDSAVMISPPEFRYQGTTLTLPLIRIVGTAGQTSSGGTARLRSADTTAISNYSKPLTDSGVNVTVRSAYYEAWGAYFEERTEGTAIYDHPNRTVTLRLVTPTDSQSVPGPIVSSAGDSDAIDLDNGAVVNAYNSSAGERPNNGVGVAQAGGTILVTGTIKLNSGNVRIAADEIKAGGNVTFDSSNVRIARGDVLCMKNNHGCVNDNVGYDPIQNGAVFNTSDTISAPDPVSDLVADKLVSLDARNDNDDTANVSANRLNWSNKNGDTLVLTNGSYYLSKIDMSNTGNQRLVLDTSGGDIELGVDGGFKLDGTTIIVRGDSGTVRVYADVSDDRGGSAEMDFTGGVVEVHDGSGSRTFEASRFWLYAPAGIDADFDRGSRRSRFTGVIYAPDDESAYGTVQLTGGIINGAVVAHLDGVDEGSNDAEIHYDEALSTETALTRSRPTKPKVTFMHISINQIEVDLRGGG